jgi:hypothetical protein
MSLHTPSAIVTHGPFPIRAGRLIAGIVAGAMAALLLVFVSMPDTLRCEALGGDCTVTRFARPPARYPRSSVLGVKVVLRRGSKGVMRGKPLLQIAEQPELPLTEVDPDDAEQFERSVEDGLAASTPFELRLRQPLAFGLFGVLLLGFGAGAIYTALRGIGRYHLEVRPLENVVSVTRLLLGIPRSRVGVATNDVVDVEVEWRRDKDFLHNRHHTGDIEGRLVLVTRDGEGRPLSTSFHRGYTLHQRAAEQLRALLRCPPRSEAQTLRAEAEARAFYPAPGFIQNAGNLGAVWLGLCCGSVAGMGLYAAFALVTGLAKGSDPVTENMAIFGAGGGALAGAAFMLHLTRPRPPR